MSVADCRPTDSKSKRRSSMLVFINQNQSDIICDSLNLRRIYLPSPLTVEFESKDYVSPRIGHKNSPEHIESIRQAHLGKKRSQQTRQNISNAVKKTYENGRVGKSGTEGKKFSEKTKKLMSTKRNEYVSTNGAPRGWSFKRTSAANKKLSETVKGRFRVYREDGSWTWGYPSKTNI